MDPILSKDPVPTTLSAFRSAVDAAMARDKLLVLVLRYANAAGAKDYFAIRSISEYESAMGKALAKTSVTVLFAPHFLYRGIVDEKTCDTLTALLPTTIEENEGIDLVCLDGQARIDDDHYLYFQTAEEISEWTEKNQGRPVLAGVLAFWLDNSDTAITAYVPDADGVVRIGAY